MDNEHIAVDESPRHFSETIIVDTSSYWEEFSSWINGIPFGPTDKEEVFAQITESLLFFGENAPERFGELPDYNRFTSTALYTNLEFRERFKRAFYNLAMQVFYQVKYLGGFTPEYGFPYRLNRLMGSDLVLSYTPD